MNSLAEPMRIASLRWIHATSAPKLLPNAVNQQKLIAVRHLRAGGRLIPVHFFRNDGGSVAGRFMLGAQDTPILDGPDPDTVLELLRDVIDELLLARKTA